MTTRRRPPENINRRLKERDHTLPDLSGPRNDRPADPRRAPSGPPLKPFMKYMDSSKDAFNALRPYLVTSMSEQQRREDASEMWSGAERYIMRSATLMKRTADRFDRFPFHGDDILTRFSNLQEIGLAASEAQQRADYLRDTYTAGMADVLRMCDVVNMETESQMNRPMLPRTERSEMRDQVALALESWNERLARIRTSAKERETLVDGYRARLEAIEEQLDTPEEETETSSRPLATTRTRSTRTPAAAPPAKASTRRSAKPTTGRKTRR